MRHSAKHETPWSCPRVLAHDVIGWLLEQRTRHCLFGKDIKTLLGHENKLPAVLLIVLGPLSLGVIPLRYDPPYTACTSTTPGTALMAPAICGETL
jgi:hypothetical protein